MQSQRLGGRGWGVEEGDSRANCSSSGPEFKHRKKERRKGRKTLHNSQSNCCLLGNEAAVWGPVLLYPCLGWESKGLPGGRVFSTLQWHSEEGPVFKSLLSPFTVPSVFSATIHTLLMSVPGTGKSQASRWEACTEARSRGPTVQDGFLLSHSTPYKPYQGSFL